MPNLTLRTARWVLFAMLLRPAAGVDLRAYSMDDHEHSRGFNPLLKRSVGGFNETGHDEPWPSHTHSQRSGFHFTAGSFKGRALLGTQKVCAATNVAQMAHRHKPNSCFSTPATEARTIQDSEDVFVAKYAPDRHLLWATHIGGPGRDLVGGIAVSNLEDSPHWADGFAQYSTVHDEARPWHQGNVNPRRSASSYSVLYAAGSADNDITVQRIPPNSPITSLQPDAATEEAGFLIEAAPQSGSDIAATCDQCLALCVTNESYTVRDSRHPEYSNASDPRNQFGDRRGECSVRAVAIDGNGDVIVTGVFFGGLIFPQTVEWEPRPRKLTPDQLEEIASNDNQLQDAIGLLAYCRLHNWEEWPCAERQKLFGHKLEKAVTELEEDDNTYVTLRKLQTKFGLEDLDMSHLFEPIVTFTPIRNPKGKIMRMDPGNSYRKLDYSEQVGPLLLNDSLSELNSKIMLQLCAGKQYQTNQMMNKTSGICTNTKNDPDCEDTFDYTCPTTWHCSPNCTVDLDCLHEYGSYCYQNQCTIDVGMCERFNGTRTRNELWSNSTCYVRAGRGRYCVHDMFVAKISKEGDFQWAVKVNYTEAGNGEIWHLDKESTHLVQNEHQDPDMLKENQQLIGNFDHHTEWEALKWVSGMHSEQNYWARRAANFYLREEESEFDPDPHRVDANFPSLRRESLQKTYQIQN